MAPQVTCTKSKFNLQLVPKTWEKEKLNKIFRCSTSFSYGPIDVISCSMGINNEKDEKKDN